MEVGEFEEEEREKVKRILSERLEAHDESRKAAQEKLHEICEGLRAQINRLEESVNSELEEKFTAEDNRLQTALDELRSSDGEDVQKKIQKAIAELLVVQTYDVIKRSLNECRNENSDEEDDESDESDEENYNSDEGEEPAKKRRKTGEVKKGVFDFASLYKLKTDKKVGSLELISFKERTPTYIIPSFTEKGELSPAFSFFGEDEEVVLKGIDSHFEVEVKVWEKGHEEGTSRTLTTEFTLGSDEPVCFKDAFAASTTYCLKMRIVHQGLNTQWSDEVEFVPEFREFCVWKECPDDVNARMKYSVDEKNPRIVTKNVYYGYILYCTIIGNTPFPSNKVTSWSIKILKSKGNDGQSIFIGVAPSDINQNEEDNSEKCGWYFACWSSTLWSGPPHNYNGKEYLSWKLYGEYVRTGDSVGVVMDTRKGELSFVLDRVNLGVAFEGIPLDKPLVPCAILGYGGDSVELVI